MRKKVFVMSSIIVAILLLLTMTYYIIRHKDLKKTDSYNNLNKIETVSKTLGGVLNITVDPRIELLTALQQQADYGRLTQLNFHYKDDMNSYFNKHKNHKAVSTFQNLSVKGFSYDAPPNVMLYLSNTLEIDDNIVLPNDLLDRASGKNTLYDFIDELKNFSYKSDFASFYNSNAPLYQAMIDNVYDAIKDMKLTEALDDYHGMDVNTYNLVLSPMLHAGGYGPRVEAENGLYDVYGIVGPQETITDSDGNTIPVYSIDMIQYLIWHEFSHSLVNPLTRTYINEINSYNSLFSKIKDQMNAQAYANWETCVNEHIIRAITARLVYLHQGQSAYDAAIATERANGFFYVPALCNSLAQYESNRDRYPTLDSYYPELITVFKDLSEQKLDDEFYQFDFIGPINNVFNSNNYVIITPTQETDIDIQEGIISYATMIKDKFFQNAEFIKDTEAINRDLGDYTILAYGTMEGNIWLQTYKDTFPFKVESDKIITDETYEDTGMVMISAMPNPQNYKNPLLIYTAQDAKDIININSVFHGPTDYIIAKDQQEVHSGFYTKEKEIWGFD